MMRRRNARRGHTRRPGHSPKGRRDRAAGPRPRHQLATRDLVEEAVAGAIEQARRDGVRGARSTPYLLAAVEKATGGRSLATNLALLERNAALAGRLAVALANDGRA